MDTEAKTPEKVHPADRLRLEYPAALPISAKAGEIRRLWEQHQLIIVGGATGSGKTTQLPKIALELGCGRRGRIGCTQPRRLAATAMARRVASELAVECGEEVGYQVRFDNRTGRDTVLKFMTDGILLAETAADRMLRQYDCLIIDEAHERSLNIDFILGYLKNLAAKRPDLKIAISSATLDVAAFSHFFADAPVVEVEGRTYPVEDCYLEPESADEELSDHVARAVDFLTELDAKGDILIFLPGEREIRDCAELLSGRHLRGSEILPLYARLAAAEQQKVFQLGSRRRIVLATNVAETSLTIPGIRFCIDSGLARISRYKPATRIQQLQIERISQASARQRRGRCGRTADGVCVHLYSEDDFNRFPAYTDPEIKRTSLAGVILQMAALHLPRIDRFPFIDPPPAPLIREGMHTLEDLLAIQPGGKVTAEGWRLSALPIDPHLGKMLLTAQKLGVLPELLVISAFLSLSDPRERPSDRQQAADDAHRRFADEQSDFIAILKLWNLIYTTLGENFSKSALRRYAKSNFLNFNRLNEWFNLIDDLAESCAENEWKAASWKKGVFELLDYERIHLALLSGIPRQFAKYVPEYQYYLGTGGRKYVIFPGSGLFKRKKPPEWLLSFALVETSRLYGRTNAEIKPDYIERIAPHLCKATYEAPYYDPASGFVYAKEKLVAGGLVVHDGRRVHYGKSHPREAREIFIRAALATGGLSLPGTWVERHAAMVKRLEKLELKLRRPGTVYDPEAVAQHFLTLLPAEVISVDALKKCREDYTISDADAMQPQYNTFDPADYPDFLTFAGQKFALEYRFDPGEDNDGVTMPVPDGMLNLLPGWALDWPIPGYLAEKVELMLRKLPKTIRQQLSPLGDSAREFAGECKAGRIFTQQPLAEALIEFLAKSRGVQLSLRDFEEGEYPQFLQLKLAELNAKGEVRQIHRAMPDRRNRSSVVSTRLGGVVDSLSCSGFRNWPENRVLPPDCPLPGGHGQTAYPAICDEGSTVGVRLFLREAEAKKSHREGLLRLFKLRAADQVKFIRRSFRLPNPIKLAWFVGMSQDQAAEELTDSAILEALGEAPEAIRDQARYEVAALRAAETLGECADRKMKTLETLFDQYEKVHELANRLKVRPGVDSRDLRNHLKFLFGPGFLRREAVWRDYPRYLRGLQLRAERLNAAPAKDAAKLVPLEPWIEKFELAASDVENLADAPELCAFWELLEECRLQCFAPEVRLRERAPLNRLAEAWKNLRF